MQLTKKLISASLIIALVFAPIIKVQAANYNAVPGAALGAGLIIAGQGLALGIGIMATGGLALAAVAAVAVVSFNSTPTVPSNAASAPLNINLNPNTPLTPPAGWTAAGSGKIQPTPPGTTTTVTHYWISTSSVNKVTDKNLIVQEQLAIILSGGDTAKDIDCSGTAASCTFTKYASNGNAYSGRYTVSFNAGPACPIGYVTSGGSNCALTNSSQVIKPVTGQQNIIIDGNNFKNDPLINPQDVFPPANVAVSPKNVTVKDSTGSTTSITINNDNSITINSNYPNSGTSNSTTETINLSPPDSSGNRTVTGKAVGIVNGQGTATPPNTSTGSDVDVSMLNKEATQVAIKADLDSIKDDIKCSSCTLPTDSTPEKRQQIMDETKKTTDKLDTAADDYQSFKGMFDWPTWIPEFPASTCSPFTGTVAGKTVSWDMCPKIAMINELIGWLFSLFTAWTITGMFFRRD